MSTESDYETNIKQAQDHNEDQRPLYGSIVRGDTPLDCGFGEVVEIASPADDDAPVQVHIDTVPRETVAKSPDSAARAAGLMLAFSKSGQRGQLGFRVDYPAD